MPERIKRNKVTVFIAVIPQDYGRAQVELFESEKEAKLFIEENAIRGETVYCSILEREILCPNP